MTWRSQVYDTAGSYSWNVPTGVSAVMIVEIGGGSGGTGRNGTNSAPAAAGGNGEFCSGKITPVTSGGTLSIVVGAGGTGFSAFVGDPATGGAGNSSAGSVIALGAPNYVPGNGYDSPAVGAGVAGGPGGVGSHDGSRGGRESLSWWGGNGPTSSMTDGDPTWYGAGDGGQGPSGNTGSSGVRKSGAGSATPFGAGTNGGVWADTNGTNATSFGAAGSGSGRNNAGGSLYGGNGKCGYVAIFWAEP